YASHRRHHRISQTPAELLGNIVSYGLRALAVLGAQVDVHDSPAESVRHLRAQPVDVVVRPPHAHQAGPVHARPDDLRRFELLGDEDPGREPGAGRVGGDGVREVAGRRAADHVETEGSGPVDAYGDNPV